MTETRPSERARFNSECRSTVGTEVSVLDVDKLNCVSAGAGVTLNRSIDSVLQVGGFLSYLAETNESSAENDHASDLIIGANGRFLGGWLRPIFPGYLQTGGDTHRLSVELDPAERSLNPLRSSDRRDGTRLGFNLSGGTLIGLSERLEASADLRYRRIIGTSDIRFDQLTLGGGIHYRI